MIGIPVHVALVDDTGKIAAADLAACAAALNEQVQSDFAPVWKVAASVGVFPSSAVPPGTWAVRVQASLDQPGALGYHTDTDNQPVALVEFTPDWSVTVSHELLEMLADPFGNRMHAAEIPQGVDFHALNLPNAGARVHYLLEVADPCEATSYKVGGVELSDFLLPGWYRTFPAKAPAYSHAGGCTLPRQVSDGGYVSFATPNGEWWQVFNEGGALSLQSLGMGSGRDVSSLREWADRCARDFRATR